MSPEELEAAANELLLRADRPAKRKALGYRVRSGRPTQGVAGTESLEELCDAFREQEEAQGDNGFCDFWDKPREASR